MPRKWTMPGNLTFKGWMHGSVFPQLWRVCACPSVHWFVICWEPAILECKYHLYIFQSSGGMRWHRKVTWGWLLYWFILLVLSFLDKVVSRMLEKRNEFYWQSESLLEVVEIRQFPVFSRTLLVESMGIPSGSVQPTIRHFCLNSALPETTSAYIQLLKRGYVVGFLLGHQPAPKSWHRDVLVMNGLIPFALIT